MAFGSPSEWSKGLPKAMREYDSLDLAQVEAHEQRVPLHGVRVRARIEENTVRFPIQMGGHCEGEPVVGRA